MLYGTDDDVEHVNSSTVWSLNHPEYQNVSQYCVSGRGLLLRLQGCFKKKKGHILEEANLKSGEYPFPLT
jgi:hypothetical protein